MYILVYTMWILEVINELKRNHVQFAVVGGYAVALHGAVRGTVDLDLVVAINLDNLVLVERAMVRLGLKSRLPVTAKDIFKFRTEYIEKRNLIAWSFVDYSNPSRVVDIVITHNLNSKQTVSISILGRKVPVLSIKELIKMKKKSARPQDLEDVSALEEIYEKNKTNS